jgi:hypothetical protein
MVRPPVKSATLRLRLFHWASAETDTWLDFAHDCGYLALEEHKRLTAECEQVGGMLGSMLNNPEPFLLKAH